ncbi:putative transmembrane protein [Cladochytrium replicatum]|nr:putative transmembrane protein [Cladochytrium replicatum]
MNHSAVHAFIIRTFLAKQRPPSILELSEKFECDPADARSALRSLADYHGVVLHPHNDKIWIAHPFSAAPTTFVVRSSSRKWWGNCAWCSLGVACLVGDQVTIETRLGALDDSVTIEIKDGQLVDTDFVVHFPVPMRNAWDNVVYTCSVMLLFRDEAQVDAWCADRGVPKGDVRPVEQVWRFAKEWYGRHADEDWTKWSMKETAEIFRRHGLAGPVWDLDHSNRSVRF